MSKEDGRVEGEGVHIFGSSSVDLRDATGRRSQFRLLEKLQRSKQ